MLKLHRILHVMVCIGMLTASVACAETQKHETAGQYVDDTVITTRVKTAIFNEANLKTLQINVKTYKAVVQLSGFVDSAENVTKAEEVAKRVAGVIAVENSLQVK